MVMQYATKDINTHIQLIIEEFDLSFVFNVSRVVNSDPIVVGGLLRDYYLGGELNDIDFQFNYSNKHIFINNIDKILTNRFRGDYVIHSEVERGFIIYRTWAKSISSEKTISVDIVFINEKVILTPDLTINSLKYNLRKGSLQDDQYNFFNSISRKIIKTCLHPSVEISNNPITSWRAARYSASLNYKMTTTLEDQIVKNRMNTLKLFERLSKRDNSLWRESILANLIYGFKINPFNYMKYFWKLMLIDPLFDFLRAKLLIEFRPDFKFEFLDSNISQFKTLEDSISYFISLICINSNSCNTNTFLQIRYILGLDLEFLYYHKLILPENIKPRF
jgi:hypothetical protein